MGIVLLITLALVPYLPLLQRFFWSDDWYILSLTQISSMGEFLRFFSFAGGEQVTPVYRPLSTEAFYFVMHRLFGLNPVPYHGVSLAVWALGGWMLFKLVKAVFYGGPSWNRSVLFFYLFSASHFTRLSYLSAFQEILMFTAGISALYLVHTKKYLWGAVLFVMALMSKESAVVIFPLMLLIEFYQAKGKIFIKNYFKYTPYFLILAGYMYLRFAVRGAGGVGENYVWNFSPLTSMNTAYWYKLWSLGVPEFMLDYVGSGQRILPRFWTDFGMQGILLVAGFCIMCLVFAVAFLLWIAKNYRSADKWRFLIFSSLWYFIALAPILFLPTHKYALGQSMALVGIALALAEIIESAPRLLQRTCIATFLLFNLFSISLYYQYHVSMQRSTISEKVYNHITQNYSKPPTGFYFANDIQPTVASWGQSKQIHQALGEHFFEVVYPQNVIPNAHYEDDSILPPKELENWTILKSSQFLP